MKTAKLVSSTLKLIFADMALNFTLGLVFTFFYLRTERLISSQTLFPPIVWCALGIGLLLFATWQANIVKRQNLESKDLVFAALMSYIPMALLAVGLLIDSHLYPLAKLLLWAGVIYMLFLGCWYLFLSRRLVD